MSKIKCFVCKGRHFIKASYEIDVDVSVHSTAHNRADASAYTNTRGDADVDVDVDVSVNVDTQIYNETDSSGDIRLYSGFTRHNVYKYICEDCGYILSFTSKKEVESKEEERKRKEKENMYDWSNFGK